MCHRLPILAKYRYTVPQGGKSLGKFRYTHPFLSRYKMAFITSTSSYLPRRRTSSSDSKCCQSRADKSELYRFRMLEIFGFAPRKFNSNCFSALSGFYQSQS